MKRLFKSLTLAAALVSLATLTSTAHAHQGLKIGKPKYNGNGCPKGSAEVVLSKDRKSLSVLMDSYNTEAGLRGKTFGRKKCDMAIPLTIPKGYQVQLMDADYRGYVELPRGAKATFSREYFFAGRIGSTLKTNWRGRTSKDYYQKDKLSVIGKNRWSSCGSNSVILRTKSSMKVNSRHGYASAGVDSLDLKNKKRRYGWNFHFNYRRCH